MFKHSLIDGLAIKVCGHSSQFDTSCIEEYMARLVVKNGHQKKHALQ